MTQPTKSPRIDTLLEGQPDVVTALETAGFTCYGRYRDAPFERYLWQKRFRPAGAGRADESPSLELWHFPPLPDGRPDVWEVDAYFERGNETDRSDACLCKLYAYSTEQMLARLEEIEDSLALAAGVMRTNLQRVLRTERTERTERRP